MQYPIFLSDVKPVDKTNHNLPHWDQVGTCVFVTFRLADSLPKERLAQWGYEREEWMKFHPKPWDEGTAAEYGREFGARLDNWLDSGYGSCVLEDSENRQIVWDAILHFDGERYDVYTFVVMPNHVHVMFSPFVEYTRAGILHSWKSFSSKMINKRTGSTGVVWQNESWDRLVRDAGHFARIARYISRNPGKRDIPVYLKTGYEDLLRV